MSRLSPAIAFLLICGWSHSATLVAQDLYGQPDATHTARQPAAPSGAVAILGAISRPGVYDLAGTRRQLSDVVEGAGGLSADSSNNLRIIRNERGNLKFYYSRMLDVPLLPNDVICCEAVRHGRAGSGARRPDEPRVSQPLAPRGEVVVLGAFGFPVIVTLPADENTLRGVLLRLGQSNRLSLVTVTPSGVRGTPSLDSDLDSPLPHDTVLIFDRKQVDLKALPQAGLPSRLKSHDVRFNPESENVRFATLPGSQTSGDTGVSLLQAPAAEGDTDAAAQSSLPPIITPLPPLVGGPAIDYAVPPPMDLPPDPTATPRARPANALADTGTTQAPLAASGPATVGQAPISGFRTTAILMSVLVVVGLAVAGIALWDRLVARQLAEQYALLTQVEGAVTELIASPVPQDVTLDRLIENQVLLVEEPVAWPTGGRVFGQPLPAASIRVDASHEVPAPHFAQTERPVIVTTEPQVAEAARAELTGQSAGPAAGAPEGTSWRRDAAHPQVSVGGHTIAPGLMDRVLTALNKEAP